MMNTTEPILYTIHDFEKIIPELLAADETCRLLADQALSGMLFYNELCSSKVATNNTLFSIASALESLSTWNANLLLYYLKIRSQTDNVWLVRHTDEFSRYPINNKAAPDKKRMNFCFGISQWLEATIELCPDLMPLLTELLLDYPNENHIIQNWILNIRKKVSNDEVFADAVINLLEGQNLIAPPANSTANRFK